MVKFRGRVATASKLSIGGWALSPDDDSCRPEIEVVQGEQVILLIIPNVKDAQVRPVLNLPRSSKHNLCRWQIMLPFSAGIRPDRPFTIRFRETKEPLEQGANITLPLFDSASITARSRSEEYVFSTYSYEQTDALVTGSVFVSKKGLSTAQIVVDGVNFGQKVPARPLAGHPLAFPAAHLPFKYTDQASAEASVSVKLETEDGSINLLDGAASLYLPAEIFALKERQAGFPDAENIRRVAGKVDLLHFLVSGFSQFKQMSELSKRNFGKTFLEFDSVCDWGVGCARTLRHFRPLPERQRNPTQKLIGLDIDQVNIDWCKKNIGFAEFNLLDRNSPILPLQDASIDLLYGISVMTHLSEYNQIRWLSEIQRVVRPSGCIILTANSDTALYERPELLQHYFAEKFGFSDLQPDTTFGEDLSTYYRVTYQTEEFTRSAWGEFFDIVEVFKAKQDFVVMRRR